MNYNSLAAGIGIGATIAAIVSFSLFQYGQTVAKPDDEPQPDPSSVLSQQEAALVYVPGLLSEIRSDTMTVDQTFGGIYETNPELELRINSGTAFFDCDETGRNCGAMQRDAVADNPSFSGTHVCIVGSTKDGVLYGGAVFLDVTCTWQSLPDT